MEEYPEYLDYMMRRQQQLEQKNDFSRFGTPYYPYTFLNDDLDSIRYPFNVKLEFNLKSVNLSKLMKMSFFLNLPHTHIHICRGNLLEGL